MRVLQKHRTNHRPVVVVRQPLLLRSDVQDVERGVVHQQLAKALAAHTIGRQVERCQAARVAVEVLDEPSERAIGQLVARQLQAAQHGALPLDEPREDDRSPTIAEADPRQVEGAECRAAGAVQSFDDLATLGPRPRVDTEGVSRLVLHHQKPDERARHRVEL